MTVALCTERERAEYNAFITRFDDATLYHLYEWYGVLEDTYGHTPQILIARSAQRIVGALPMMLVRAPFLGSKLIATPYQASAGTPLAEDDAVAHELLEAAIELGQKKGAGYVEVRGPAEDARLLRAGFTERHAGTYDSTVDVQGMTRSKLARGHRQDVNRVDRLGIDVREATTLDEWRTFYEMFEELQRSFAAIGLGWAIFENLFERMPTKAKVRLARLDGEVIAGCFLLCHHQTIFSKQAVVRPEHVRTGIGKGLVWSTLDWGKAQGYERLNLGISLASQEAVRKFKAGFAAEARPLSSYVVSLGATPPSYEELYDGYGLAKKVWVKMPLPATKLGGAVMTRWFC